MCLSVVIITLNASRTLRKTLQSLPQGAQIIVVDSGSTDSTQEICIQQGVEFHYKQWTGFGPQREAAAKLCIHPWILYLDADEWLSPELREQITHIVKTDATDTAYKIRRLSYLQGKLIRCGDWGKDYVTRLVPKEKAKWIGTEPHPRIEEKHLHVVKVDNPIYHDPYANLQQYEEKIRAYARTWALCQYSSGMTETHFPWALTKAAWRWFRGYILRAGFLDGKQGWLIATMSAKMVIYKHLELKQLTKTRKTDLC